MQPQMVELTVDFKPLVYGPGWYAAVDFVHHCIEVGADLLVPQDQRIQLCSGHPVEAWWHVHSCGLSLWPCRVTLERWYLVSGLGTNGGFFSGTLNARPARQRRCHTQDMSSPSSR
jgi:hypothetical protein